MALRFLADHCISNTIVQTLRDATHEVVARQMRNHAEVLGQVMARLKEYLGTQPAMAHYARKLFVVEVNRIRIRE